MYGGLLRCSGVEVEPPCSLGCSEEKGSMDMVAARGLGSSH